jgi:thiol:disulfide interchange protein DsbD
MKVSLNGVSSNGVSSKALPIAGIVAGIVIAVTAAATIGVAAQDSSIRASRPKAELTPVVSGAAGASVAPGAKVRLTMKVHLPEGIHVQSDKPRDPYLIPTVLTLDAPAGVTVGKIAYPPPHDFTQAGQDKPLAVFEQDFAIGVDLTLAGSVAQGPLVIPAHLKYQACDEKVCYPPAKADARWELKVAR